MTRIVEGDTIGAADCLALVRGLTSRDRDERLGAAVVADDWFSAGGFDYTEDVAVAWVLAWAAVREAPGRVPVRVLDRVVAHLAGARLDPVEEGLLADLRRSGG
ncbi:hypothetical protein [Pseudonocardia humida]|uniref:Uncharacterized protein n=1 Tax=Pseudonocardia humida TaxID=2800819 RepID=A0ABT0ZTC5_9PSEU|nr:hypothetical protein [Pseudonocardia humida]MCO1653964.1 hypothetical protein [Pseudonocardia humida]